MTVNFPSNLSSSMTDLIVPFTKVVSPIPDANWDRVTNFQLEATGVKCPLPPGLVAHLNAGKNLTECTLDMNDVTIDRNNMVCGQIHVSKMPCMLSGSSYTAPYFATDDVKQATNFTAHLGNFTIEFVDDEAMVFTTYATRNGGARKEYRREYLSFRIQPIGETYGGFGATGRKRATLNRSFWNTFVVETNRVRANSTKENDLIQEYIFEYTLNDEKAPFVKVSNAIYNLGHQWLPSPGRLTKVSLFYIFSFRLSHSPSQGDALACTKANAGGSSCFSSVSNLDQYFDFASGNTILVARTKTIEFRYAYGLVGTIDGAPLYSNSSFVNAARLPVPLPSSRWLEANRRGGFIVKSNNLTDEVQSFCVPVELAVPEFRDKFYFDPDVSITLLFDPEGNLAPEQTDTTVQAATSVGLIVGLVVAGVIVVASLTVFATVVFPYLRRRKWATKDAVELEEESVAVPPGVPEVHHQENRRESTWVRSRTPSQT
eukprot:TRINITY_DN1647_c0_g1_i1.p1 TRINITY_DN1647_c0_g1~~TRINITY_DN1647_c0_g1_i1.p1  ORF type:complete len:487 (+),score=57.37 TRINITY_DN1647_c0_g1_i1:541-2001(+)